MKKYRMSGGLAMSPEREMKLLKEMSRKGWHLSDMKTMFYCFEQGEPHNYQYALNFETHVNEEMLSLYKESGWVPVVANAGYQIFRAEEGTSPIFSDSDSETEILYKNRNHAGKWALIFSALIVIFFIIAMTIEINQFIVMGLLWLLFCCLIFNLFPFIGFSVSLYKKNKR